MLKKMKRKITTNRHKMDGYVVYILRSEVNKDLMYCGMSRDYKSRLRQHNGELAGGGQYTSNNRPWKIAAIIPVSSKEEALKVEWWTKAKNYPFSEQNKIPTCDAVTRRVYLIIQSMKRHHLTNIQFFDEDFTNCYKNMLL